jgi:hypothetical protein
MVQTNTFDEIMSIHLKEASGLEIKFSKDPEKMTIPKSSKVEKVNQVEQIGLNSNDVSIPMLNWRAFNIM